MKRMEVISSTPNATTNQERSHGDGIAVTSESPEAFEEMLWMAFFADQHAPSVSAVLDRTAHNPAFERCYRNHIRKLLAVRGGHRYVAKGNYNLTRIGYLAKLFPDARFVIPVRDPVWHVASLMKQHRLFLDGQRDNPRAQRHLRRVGHFEFGQDRQPINVGDSAATADILELWRSGEEVRGWARYWSLVHNYVAGLIETDAALRRAIHVLRYEELCATPRPIMTSLLNHCDLNDSSGFLSDAAARFHQPTYYRPDFKDSEMAIIADETAAAARLFGYNSGAATALRQSAQ